MIKFVTSQMLQSEEIGKQLMIQGQLQLVIFFANVLKPKTRNGNGSSGNWLKGINGDNYLWFILPFVKKKT